jgi:Subtilase family
VRGSRMFGIAAALAAGLVFAQAPKSPPTGVPVFPSIPGGGLTATPPPRPPPVIRDPPPGGPPTTRDPRLTPSPTVAVPAPGIPLPPVEQPTPTEVLVAWRSTAEADAGVAEIAARYGVSPIERIVLNALGRIVATYAFGTQRAAIDLRSQLLRDRPEWLADLNTSYVALDDPRQYAAEQIDLPRSAGGTVVGKVGMLDTAVEAVPALAASKLVRKRLLRVDAVPASPSHGTAIATLIAGRDTTLRFDGAAHGVDLYSGEVMQVVRGREEASAKVLLIGLDWLLAEQVRIVNLSLGGSTNRLLGDALATILARGTVVVAAAGNSGPNASPSYPAAYPGVIAVTANDALGRAYERANRGAYIAISAPGVDVWVPDGSIGRYVSGTSFAAAWVTGAVARLAMQARALNAPQARSQLCASARDLGAPGRDPVFGCGLLQAGRALEAAATRTSR